MECVQSLEECGILPKLLRKYVKSLSKPFDYGDNAKDTSLLEVKKIDFACSNFHSFISHCFGHLTSVDPHFLPGPKLFGFWSKVLSFKRKKTVCCFKKLLKMDI
jgi:hypothetical protein